MIKQINYKSSKSLVNNVKIWNTSKIESSSYWRSRDSIEFILFLPYFKENDNTYSPVSLFSIILDEQIVKKYIDSDNMAVAKLLFNTVSSDETKLFLKMKWGEDIEYKPDMRDHDHSSSDIRFILRFLRKN